MVHSDELHRLVPGALVIAEDDLPLLGGAGGHRVRGDEEGAAHPPQVTRDPLGGRVAAVTATGQEIVAAGQGVTLAGGEIAAMALLDAVARLQPGVLGDEDSHQFDSFNPALDGLLDCPHYTRPEDWEGLKAPPELLSGHHKQIERWRRDRRLEITARRRPDLIERARAQGRLGPADEALLAKLA